MENVYKVAGKKNWEFWLAKNEDEAKSKFEEYFKEKVVSCSFEVKAQDAVFTALINGMVMRW